MIPAIAGAAEDQVIPRWYMAGWSGEVEEQLLARRLADRPVVMFRALNGDVAALRDRCPHRFAPLSRGTREGDTIRCGYHGLTFGSTGQCVHNPFGDQIPKGAFVHTYPVREQDGIVWIWLSDPALMDSAVLPDFGFLTTTAANQQFRGYTRLSANYEYGTDNLMDLSHIEFVHRGSFAGQGVIFAGTHKVSQEGETLHSDWWMPNVAPPGHTMGLYPPDAITDHWLEMRWNAPANMYLQIGATLAGRPRDEGIIVHQIHALCPETSDSSHYFWASTAAVPLTDPPVAAAVKALFDKAFDEEDKPTIEAAYRNIEGGEFWEQKPVFLGVDAGGLRARRVLERIRKSAHGPLEAAVPGEFGSR
jgi:nitrite reductase/ring-hydroxylating ferredoxin subunit